MSDALANALESQSTPAPAPTPQPSVEAIPAPTVGLPEVDAPKKGDQTPTPKKDSYSRDKFKTPDAVYDAYDELFTKSFSSIGETKNKTEEIAKTLADLPNQLASKLAETLASLQPKPPQNVEPPPKTDNGEEQFGGLKFSADEMLDPDAFSNSMTRQLAAAFKQRPVQTFDEAKFATAMQEKFAQTVDQKFAERETAQAQARVQTEIQELVQAGNSQELVDLAVLYGVKNKSNSVKEAWNGFQIAYPTLFQRENANNIIADAAGQRIDVPRDLGSGAKLQVDDAIHQRISRALRTVTPTEELL